VDLNDFLRSGGDLDAVIAEAIPAEEHPAVREEQKRMYARIAADIKQQRDRQRWIESGKKPRRGESVEDLKARMPTPSSYTGIPPGGRGSHPVYGSIHGTTSPYPRTAKRGCRSTAARRKGKAATSSS